LLMLPASRWRLPSAPLRLMFSLPARSTRCSFLQGRACTECMGGPGMGGHTQQQHTAAARCKRRHANC
jgi:hypothetical protein